MSLPRVSPAVAVGAGLPAREGNICVALVSSLFIVCASCVDDPEPPAEPQTCAESEVRISDIAQDMIARFASPCSEDADCRVVRLGADCPNGERFGLADEAIAFDKFQEAGAYVASRADEVCLPEQCSFPSYDNFYQYAYCDDVGACRGTYGSPDQVCPALVNALDGNANQFAESLSHPCSVDEDCFSYTPVWECPEFDLRAEGCPLVLSINEDIEPLIEDAMEVLCQERHFSCDARAICGIGIAPACVDGVCINNEG